MAANNNLNPEWQPPEDPGDQNPRTRDWKRLTTQYVYELRAQQANLNSAVQNVTNNLNQTINQSVFEIINGNNNNSGLLNPPVIFGPHVQKLTLNPANSNGYIFVETDRFEAQYYSDGLQWIAIGGTGTGSFESRWAGLNSADSGLQWIETSRSNNNGLPPYPLYRWDGNNWNFLRGEFYRNQADLTTLANTFNSANSNNGNDVGAIVNVIDFAGQLQWTSGNAWSYGPEDCRMHGMGPILSEVDPDPLTGWQLYAGNNNVTYLKKDGTTGNVNLPNLVSAANTAFLQAGNVSSGNTVSPAVAPVFTGNAASGNVSATFTGTANNFTTDKFTINPIGNDALISPTSITPSGNVAATFAGNNVTGTISNNGVPPNITRRPWFRR